MKRLLPVLAVLLLLAGCRTQPDPTPVPTAPPQASATPSPTPAPTPTPEPTPEPTPTPEPRDEDLVSVAAFIPGIFAELKYATEDNFTGQVIYDFTQPSLRYGTVKKLAKVQEELSRQGYALKIWDAYRPTQAQFKLWEICPDPTYVADPRNGFSNHSRGNTVDVTLVFADGSEVEMPTGFDDFSPLADRDYSDVPSPAADHVRLLEETMVARGFKCYFGEWWHFTDTDTYPVVEE